MKIALTNFYQQYKYQIILVFCILLIYYPFSLFIYIPKWDNINAYLPYRFFVSDYVWNGHLPLWNPFQNMGYPGYSDLQGACWYPVVWLIMLFGKYDITSLIIELLFTIILGGLGMFKLSYYFHKCKKTAFILSLCFAASGFMTGSNQLLVFLIGVAWLPWCIWSLLSFFNTFQIKYIVYSAIFVALETTGASPAFTIILIYIYFFLFIYAFWSNRKKLVNLKKMFFASLILIGLIVLLLLPYIQSFLEFAPYFSRGEKLPYQDFLIQNPFGIAHYISFLFPYTVISASEIFNLTDLSLRNGYVGIIGIVGFLFTILNYKKFSKTHVILMICALSSLLIALGNDFFGFKYLYNLPGFGFFRHPSFFRSYAMLSIILLSGFWIKEKISSKTFTKNEKKLLLIALILLLLILILSYFKTSKEEIYLLFQNILNQTEFHKTYLFTHLFFNVLFLLLLIFLCVLIYKFTQVSFFTVLVIFTFSELFVQSFFTAPTTMYYNIEYKGLKKYFHNLSNEHNQNFNYTPLKKLDDTQGLKNTAGIWQNIATFNKSISSVGINPIKFKSFEEAYKNNSIKIHLENPLFYFSTNSLNSIDSLNSNFTLQKILEIKNVKVTYNEFSVQIKNFTNQEQNLVLNQNFHHLWKAKFNNKELKVYNYKNIVNAVKIPKQSSGKITFIFESPYLLYSFIISLLTYFLLLFFWVKGVLKRNKTIGK
jgi:hypothetical protein